MDTLTLIVQTVLLAVIIVGLPSLIIGTVGLFLIERESSKAAKAAARRRAMRYHPAGKSL